MGDDLVDLALLNAAGVSVAVANAVPEVKQMAHYITQATGGNGAIRELSELILKAQNKWDVIVESFVAEL